MGFVRGLVSLWFPFRSSLKISVIGDLSTHIIVVSVPLGDLKEGGSVGKHAGREGTKCLNKTRTLYMPNNKFSSRPYSTMGSA